MSPEQIQAVAPKCSAAWAAALVDAMNLEVISTPARAAPFIAQMAHESAGFTRFEENLNYSAARLMAVWPSRFPRMEIALLYSRDPEKIANRVYAKRLGNGPEDSGDGWRYRGRGCIQLTGRDNYRKAGEAIDWPLEAMPDDAAQPWPGAKVADWFWRSRGCNELADGNTEESFKAVCRKINGGLIGYDDRMRWWGVAKKVFNADQESDGSGLR